MPLKRKMSEGAYDIVPQDPHDMVKDVLPEPQSPTMESCISRLQYILSEIPDIRRSRCSRRNLPVRGVVRNDLTKGDERGTYVVLERLAFRNVGSPTGRETYGDGASIVVRGRESRPHGEGKQVS
jgi:hypothetical protein